MVMLISLREFVATGRFGPLTPECTPAALEAVFGPPEAKGGTSRKYSDPVIWKYGDLEFCFDRQVGTLSLIHVDRFSGADASPRGWEGLVVDPWIIREGLSLASFMAEIAGHVVEGTVHCQRQFDQDVLLLPSGVQIRFIAESEPDVQQDGLVSISRQMAK